MSAGRTVPGCPLAGNRVCSALKEVAPEPIAGGLLNPDVPGV